MALRKPDPSTDNSVPPFETDDDTAVADAAVATPPAGAKAEDTTAAASATKPAPAPQSAVAPRTANAVSVAVKSGALRGLQNSIPTEELASMAIGVFPRITVSQGGFVVDKKDKLGARIQARVISWNFLWMIVTGEQNNQEANKLIRSSYDNKMLSDGSDTVENYLAKLKAEGYDKAAVKQYVEVYCNLLKHEAKQGSQIVTVEIPEDEQQLYQISLSPQSVGQWGRYQLESGLRAAKGFTDDVVVTMEQKEKTLGPNTFAYATFSPKW